MTPFNFYNLLKLNMKKLVFIFAITLLAFTQSQAQTTQKELKHIVLFTFKSSSSAASIDSVVKAFNHLYLSLIHI